LVKTPTRAEETFWRFTYKIAYVFLLLVKTPTRAEEIPCFLHPHGVTDFLIYHVGECNSPLLLSSVKTPHLLCDYWRMQFAPTSFLCENTSSPL
jgi:hypothetical protein